MVNIDTDAVIAQMVSKREAQEKAANKGMKFGKFEFDKKHYLNTRLAGDETEKEIVIRLLPFSQTENSPFKKVKVHSVKAKTENGVYKWKKFMCPIGMEKSDKCPFCETSRKAWAESDNATDEALKEKLKETAKMNSVRDYWLVRCIERGKESEGVKFWRFADSKKGDGIWDKIYSLFETKYKRGVNIFDLREGKDLIITIKKQKDASGKESNVYQVQDDERITPLADNEAQMEAWVNDPMTWDDVYSVKSYEYLEIVVMGDYPVWSKEQGKWIPKSTLDMAVTEATNEAVTEALTTTTTDYSSFTVNTTDDDTTPDDDLPF